MINSLEISNALLACRTLEYEKVDKDFLCVLIPKFDVYTGQPVNPERYEMSVQNIVDRKTMLERELEACETLLEQTTSLGLDSKEPSI